MKKALLVISFGTSYHETRIKNIEACEADIQKAFPDRDFFRAWTSSMIRKKIAKRDQINIDSPKEALERLLQLGYTDIAIQSLHVINGDEFEKIISEVAVYQDKFEKIVIGKPLLNSFDDYQFVIDALCAQSPILQPDERILLMGHGASHHAFSAYACLAHMLRERNLPIMLGAVESYPELDSILPQLMAAKIKKVHLMPFMVVAGDHAINDMASEHEDSWSSQIRALGIETENHLCGLGENKQIRALFVQHLQQALNEGNNL